ncbi:peptide ABC transporter substrate-binding protein [Streptomyces sp. bgisy153]|uniref:peptide ABC transporter substrate-binding protein n=1 Tax=Streptomyces sp. bgisy153 TaxID=3413793 RepID=UPI003D7200B5
MRGARSAKWVAMAAVVALGATACGGGGSEGSGSSNGIVSMEIGEPQHGLVPSNTYESEGGEVVAALFTGLVKLQEDNTVSLDMAQSIETTDNKVWTIKLKEGYTFHNGEKVTSSSFIDAWNYAANQENAQETNALFNYIEGYPALNPGEGKKPATDKLSGLKQADDLTFQVTLERPFAPFKSLLSFSAFSPLPKAFFEDPKKFEDQPIGNGPFKIQGKFEHNQKIDLVAYDKHPDASKYEVKGINFRVYQDPDTHHKDLLAGNLDVEDDIPVSGMPTVKKDLGDRYVEAPDSGVGYLGFPLAYNKAFQKPDLRRAISMSIDRKAISEKIFVGTRMPADDFISPIIPGYRQGACGESCTLNPAKAKELYKQSGGLPNDTLELSYNADGGHKDWIEAVANQIRANLGIKVNVKPYEQFQGILNDLGDKKLQAGFRMAWSMDYPNMENYLRPIFSKVAIDNGSNYAGYVNEEFEKLIAAADKAPSEAESTKLYQQADDVLLKDMPYIPVYFYTLNAAHSDKIKPGTLKVVGGEVQWDAVKLN